MNLLAVKAAQDRAKYIVDKYHYGIECNQCKYDYTNPAMDDFISQCYDICSTDLNSTLILPGFTEPVSEGTTISETCGTSITEVTTSSCSGPTVTNI